MFHFDNKKHHSPHIHAQYAEFGAVVAIDEGDILEGELPKSKMTLVQAWIEIHKNELRSDWQRAVEGKELLKIDPLQ